MLTSCFFLFNEIVYIIGSLSRKKLEIHFCDKSQKFITLSPTECLIEIFFGGTELMLGFRVIGTWYGSHFPLNSCVTLSNLLCLSKYQNFYLQYYFVGNDKNSMYFYRIYYISDPMVSISCFLTHRIPSPNMILFSQSLTRIRHCSGHILFHLEIKYWEA